MSAKPLYPADDENGDPNGDPICPATGTYCTGEFCDDYGCAKAVGIYDDDEP